jgi:hypothetical protein
MALGGALSSLSLLAYRCRTPVQSKFRTIHSTGLIGFSAHLVQCASTAIYKVTCLAVERRPKERQQEQPRRTLVWGGFARLFTVQRHDEIMITFAHGGLFLRFVTVTVPALVFHQQRENGFSIPL